MQFLIGGSNSSMEIGRGKKGCGSQDVSRGGSCNGRKGEG
jgi:hypothetical protein